MAAVRSGWGGALPVCYLIEVYDVDGFMLTSRVGPGLASLTGRVEILVTHREITRARIVMRAHACRARCLSNTAAIACEASERDAP